MDTGKWTQLAPLVRGRHGSGAILYNDRIYLAAGSQNKGGGNMNSIEVFSAKHDWQALSSGKKLRGWEVKCSENDKYKNYWTVDNGAILCNTHGNKDHQCIWLQSVDEFGDFELRLKFQVKRENKGNLGVVIRSHYDENSTADEYIDWLAGAQIDIEPNKFWRNVFRWIYPSLPNGEISKDEYISKKVVYYWDDEGTGWNDMRLVCKGMKITIYINNIEVVDYDGTGVIDNDDHLRNKVLTKGHIAFQLHKNTANYIRLKDIEIREFK